MFITSLSRAASLSAVLLLSVSGSALAQTATQPAEDEIIVTGSPLVRSVDEAITGVSVLTGQELSDRLAGTIGETLKSEPGVSSTFFGAGASRPIIRGQGGDRVRVLTNGIGSIDASSASPDHAVAAEPAQAERIEVLRGASLLRYGSSGSGGIVNVIDGRIPTRVPDDIEAAIRIGASSVDLGREVAASADIPAGNNFVIHLDGTWRETDNYKIPDEAESAIFHALEHAEEHDDHDDDDHDDHDDDHDEHEEETPDRGSLENSFSSAKSFTGGLSYVGGRGFFGAALHRYESDYGIPGGHEHAEEDDHHDEDDDDHDDHDHDDDDHDHEEEGHDHEEEAGVTIGLEQTRLDLNGGLKLDGFIERVQFFGGVADYKHTEFEAPGEVGTVFTNKGYEGRLEAIQAESNGWSAAYGLQLRSRKFSAIGEEAFVAPTKTNQIGAYMFHEKELGDIHLEGAARYERTDHENKTTGQTRDFDLFSLSGGGDIHLTDTIRLGGTVFRTERAPTSEELFSNGPHLATSQFERGDFTLDKEVATGIEAAFRHRQDNHFITVNAFYTDYENYIFEADIGEEEDGLPVFLFTGADATFQGAEIHAGHDLGRVGSFEVSADVLAEYVRAKTDSGNLPRIPPLSILPAIEAESERFKFRAEIDYAASQKKLAEGEIPTDDYALTNLFATWKAPTGAQNVRLSLSVLNLMNVDARQHTSFLKDVVPLPGRNVRFSISADF